MTILKVLLLDQMVHLLILYIATLLYMETGSLVEPLIGMAVPADSIQKVLNILLGLLICGQPASLLIRMFFGKILEMEKSDAGSKSDCNEIKVAAEENPKIGSYIGILEREIIFLLGIMGQFGAKGLVMAAKSIARYKQLEDQSFAEKYLIGTLLSVAIAIVCIGLYRVI